MDVQGNFIQVILPLKIEWEPYYRVGGEGLFESEPVTLPCIGDRIKVKFAGKYYFGVVSAVDVQPNIDPSRIDRVAETDTGLEKVSEQEIELWRFVSQYYLCTVGEVYKAAYPSSRTEAEQVHIRAEERATLSKEKEKKLWQARIAKLCVRLDAKQKDLAKKHSDAVIERLLSEEAKIKDSLQQANLSLSALEGGQGLAQEAELATEANPTAQKAAKADPITAQGAPTAIATASETPTAQGTAKAATLPLISAFTHNKPVLLQAGFERFDIYQNIAAQTLAEGKSVLLLVSNITLAKRLQTLMEQSFGPLLLVNHSAQTSAQRRKIAETARSGKATIILSTRFGIFLPFNNLGLIIIDGEESAFYKQSDNSPHYNGRDLAIVLGKIHGAKVLLGSASPSLETIVNLQSGKFVSASPTLKTKAQHKVYLIDTSAERKKNGMIGCLSRKLIKELQKAKGNTAIIRGYEKEDELQEALRQVLLENQNIPIFTIPLAAATDLSCYQTIVLLSAEALFRADDFRSDERAYQFLFNLKQSCSYLIVQTSNSEQQVFSLSNPNALLSERKLFSLPPYTRLVDVLFPDYISPTDSRPGTLSRLLQRQGFAASDALTRPDGRLFIRVAFQRDANLGAKKETLCKAVEALCKEYKIRVQLDVDPL